MYLLALMLIIWVGVFTHRPEAAVMGVLGLLIGGLIAKGVRHLKGGTQ